MVLAVALPIMVQNGITQFVNLLDNLMVDAIGTEQMSGVSICNQLIFVFNLCIFGGHAGAGIFGAQYFGKGEQQDCIGHIEYRVENGNLYAADGRCAESRTQAKHDNHDNPKDYRTDHIK